MRLRGTLILLLLLSGPAVLQAADPDQPARDACQKYADVSVPKGDAPSAVEIEELSKCDSAALYYGFEHAADADRARKCAYTELDKHGAGSPLSGAAVLAMVYANGNGAKRDFALALRFACEAGGAPAEVEGRVAHLEKLAREPAPSTFDFCDDITSGYMEGFCAQKQAQIDKFAQAEKVKSVILRWTKVQKTVFLQLQQAAKAFFDARSLNEVDLSGTNRAAQSIAERQNLENGFNADIARFEAGNLPNFNLLQMQRAAASLRAAYSHALEAQTPEMGTVTADGIQKTQVLWAAYRDAWIKFGGTKYPRVTAASWRTWLTRERTEQLLKLAPQQ